MSLPGREIYRRIERRGLTGSLALLPALAGWALVAYAMFGRYDRMLELAGFALLAGAVAWDFRLRSRSRCNAHGRDRGAQN